MRISLFIPCYNEEESIEKSIQSWLNQTVPFDQIVVVDDCSTDNTPNILKKYEDQLTIVRSPKNTGNKSSAQEYGLQFVDGDIFVTTDGDTLLEKDFVKHIIRDFDDPEVAAVSGRVRSLKYNWLTACRALDYFIGCSIDKRAQDYIGYIFVISGAAGAFRTKVFKEMVKFDHDTITEDLDFTYKLHKLGYKIKFNDKAVCFTQDPSDLKSYINQMRRWYGGGWQNLVKHLFLPHKPGMAFELTVMYAEGLIFSTLLFIVPLINIILAIKIIGSFFVIAMVLALIASYKEKRIDLVLSLPGYIFLKYVNSWVYLEQFVKIVILKKGNLTWFKPKRVAIEEKI